MTFCWPRDSLFKYYLILEALQENLTERQELLALAGMSIVNTYIHIHTHTHIYIYERERERERKNNTSVVLFLDPSSFSSNQLDEVSSAIVIAIVIYFRC